MNNRLIKSNDAGGGACTNTVDLYNPFPDGGGVALYQLNGDATDVSGNYDGTATNVTYGTGVFGQAGVFNGSSSYITATGLGITGNTSFTISTWVNTTSSSSNLFFFFGNGALNASLYISVESGGVVRVGDFGTDLFSSTTSVNDGNWHHIALTSNGTTTKLYIDGSESNSLSYTWAISADNMELGRGTSSYYYNGKIDQVRIFSRALRPYEVEALYTEEYCTPTIVPSEHFNTVLYTGTGATNSVTGVGFQPDFVWLKKRSGVDDHFAFDSIRGAKSIYPNLTNAEDSFTFSFDTDGFTVPVSGGTNGNGDTFVAWNFKAGGAAVTNTDGTITSQVSANTEAGFSIVSYTASGGGNYSVGHGLGQTPDFVIVKPRNENVGWTIWSSTFPNLTNSYINFTTMAVNTAGTVWGSGMTSTVIGQTSGATSNPNQPLIAYCFAEVEGFSNFGSYVTTSDVATNVITGFEPAFVMIKAASDLTSGFEDYRSWVIYDNKRNITDNQTTDPLYANRSYQEGLRGNGTAGVGVLDFNFNSNGFSINVGSVEARGFTGEKFIYMAFAADPTAVEPTLEDSFNTVTYTGNGGTQTLYTTSDNTINGTGGFQPDLVWVKNRSAANPHSLQDTVRGDFYLRSNATDAEAATSGFNISSYNDKGFTVKDDTNGAYNVNGSVGGLYSGDAQYVAWAWKGAEIPAINSNGSIPSVVSANPAAGFSIVSYTGNYTNATVGHGLGIAPNVIIVKSRSSGTANWCVYHSSIGATGGVFLNLTNAAQYQSNLWLDTQPTSEVFSIGQSDVNVLNSPTIAYCFAEVAGFSKFGSYTGTGVSGKSVPTDFEPAFIMVKRTDNISAWRMIDNKRFSGGNKSSLEAQDSSAEQVGYIDIDFNATNFTINSTNVDFNASGGTYIYMAFANQF